MSTRTWKVTPSKRRPAWSVVIGPYDEDFIASLKHSVPPTDREWNPALKAWLVHESVLDAVGRIIDEHSDEPPPASPLASVKISGHQPYIRLAREVLTTAEMIGPDKSTERGETFDDALVLGAEQAFGRGELAGPDDLRVIEWSEGGKRYALVCAILEVGR